MTFQVGTDKTNRNGVERSAQGALTLKDLQLAPRPRRGPSPVRLAESWGRLPHLVAEAVADVESLFQTNGTRHLEAQIRGDMQRVLQLAASKPRGGQVQIQWLGIIRDLRTALERKPLPIDLLRELFNRVA